MNCKIKDCSKCESLGHMCGVHYTRLKKATQLGLSADELNMFLNLPDSGTLPLGRLALMEAAFLLANICTTREYDKLFDECLKTLDKAASIRIKELNNK